MPNPTSELSTDGSPNAATKPQADSETGSDTDSETGGESNNQQVGQAARGTALNLIGAVCTAVVSFVTVGLITNNYAPAGAGLFFAATAAFTLAAQAARLGSEAGLTYFVARLRATDDQGRIRSLVTTALLATGVVSALFGLVGLVFANPLAKLLSDNTSNHDELTLMIRVLAIAVPAYAMSQAMFGATRGFGTMRPSVLSGQIIRPLAQLAFVTIAIVMSGEVWPLAVAWAAAAIVAWIPVSWWLRSRVRRISKPSTSFGLNHYWRFAAPRAMADLVSSLLERLDVILVAMLINEAGAGLYGTSNRLILAGQMMMMATSQSMAPHLSASFAQGRNQDARNILQTVSGWNVVLLWPVFICLGFGAETTLSLFGADFADAEPLVVVLSIGLLIVIALGMGDTLLLMTGDSVVSLVNHVIGLAVMVGISVVTLPRIGVVGAAWAWAASRIVLRLLAAIRVWRTKGIHAIGPPVLTAMAIAAAAYIPLGAALYNLLGSSWTTVFLHVGLGSALYLGAVTRFRSTLEVDQLLNVVARRKR